jgi:hypothetical protein
LRSAVISFFFWFVEEDHEHLPIGWIIPSIIKSGGLPPILDILLIPNPPEILQEKTLALIEKIASGNKEYLEMINSSNLISNMIIAYRSSPNELLSILMSFMDSNIRFGTLSDQILLLPIIFDQLRPQKSNLPFMLRCYQLLLHIGEAISSSPSSSSSSSSSSSMALQMEIILNILKNLEFETRDLFQRYGVEILHLILVKNHCPVPSDMMQIVLNGFTSLLSATISHTFRAQRLKLEQIYPCILNIVTTCLDQGSELTWTMTPIQLVIDSGLMTVLLRQFPKGDELPRFAECVLEITNWTVQKDIHLFLDHLVSCGLLPFLVHLIISNPPQINSKALQDSDPKRLMPIIFLFRKIIACDEKYSVRAQEMKMPKSVKELLFDKMPEDGSREKLERVKKEKRGENDGMIVLKKRRK